MWIKICGITRLEDAEAAARFGADAVGFIFAESPRKISPRQAAGISRSMPPGPARVGVFMNHPLEEVTETAEYCGLDMVQLHGEEDERYYSALCAGVDVIKAVRVNGWADLARIRSYPCHSLLVDGYGSNGEGRFDWRLLSLLPREMRLIIAGGLNPENAGEAIRLLRPYGVDVARGVETAPGVKDPVLMYRFIERARKAEREVTGN